VVAWVQAKPGDHVPPPRWIEAGWLVDRFGAPAVYGRPLGYREMHAIMLAESVERVLRKWQDKNAGKWFAEHPSDKTLLVWAQDAFKHG
jgi:hypothetical protein